jgi:hypothetical protein
VLADKTHPHPILNHILSALAFLIFRAGNLVILKPVNGNSKLLEVRMPLDQLPRDLLLFRWIFHFLKDAADGEGPDILTPVIDILFPGVDQEAHGTVALDIPVFLRPREGDHVELPARDVGYIGHQRTVWFSALYRYDDLLRLARLQETLELTARPRRIEAITHDGMLHAINGLFPGQSRRLLESESRFAEETTG